MKRLLLLFMIIYSTGVHGQKIADLPRATVPAATDLIIIDQDDATRAITVAGLLMGPPAPWVGLFPDGTAGAPGGAFWNDLDVGFYRPGADILGFTAGAVEGFRITEVAGAITSTFVNDVWVQDTLFFAYDSVYIVDDTDSLKFFVDDGEVLRLVDVAGAGKAWFGDGTRLLPSMSFINMPDAGFYKSGANSIGFASKGALHFVLQESEFKGELSGAPDFINKDGTATVPNILSDRSDVNTGLGAAGLDSLSLIAGGVEGIRIAEGSGKIRTTMTDTTIIEEGLIITNLASSNTLVLTPTVTGIVDTLETADIATEAMSVTGLWTFDNMNADSATVDTLSVSSAIVNEGGYNYGGAEAGGDDAYTITVSGVAAYTAGMIVTFLATTDNTGACSLDINSIGVGSIKDQAGGDPADSYIDANSFVMVGYDGTNFVLLTPDANP